MHFVEKSETLFAIVGKKWNILHMRLKKLLHFSHFANKSETFSHFVEKIETISHFV